MLLLRFVTVSVVKRMLASLPESISGTNHIATHFGGDNPATECVFDSQFLARHVVAHELKSISCSTASTSAREEQPESLAMALLRGLANSKMDRGGTFFFIRFIVVFTFP